MEPGIDILNCFDGHTEIRFPGDDPIEKERAKRIIKDMLRRGYVLFVHGADGALIRVEDFDQEKAVYIIADGPLYPGDLSSGVAADATPVGGEQETSAPEPAPRKRGRPRKTEVPMSGVRATAIGRSAGG